MRARLFALLILLLLVWGPIFGYWYFFRDTISGVTVAVPSGESFSIELQWTLSYSWLPLADKFLVYRQDCAGSCTFSPIPPVSYSLTLTSTGKVKIEDTFTLKTGEKKNIQYKLNTDVTFLEFPDAVRDSTLGISLVDSANNTLSWTFTFVWMGDKDQVYAIRKQDSVVQLWLLFPEKFIPFRTLSWDMWGIQLDATRRFFLIELSSGKTLILSTDMTKEVETILFPIAVVGLQDSWKIQTQSGVYLYNPDLWVQENPRFTDFLDISPSKRLWYIAANDSLKLSLSNFPAGESVLVLLDRTNGKSYVVKKGVSIRSLYFEWDTPVYVDSAGKVWKIELNN